MCAWPFAQLLTIVLVLFGEQTEQYFKNPGSVHLGAFAAILTFSVSWSLTRCFQEFILFGY